MYGATQALTWMGVTTTVTTEDPQTPATAAHLAHLAALRTRSDGEAYLRPMTKRELLAIARALDVAVGGSDRKATIVRRIIEATVGARLDAAAIRGRGTTSTSGVTSSAGITAEPAGDAPPVQPAAVRALRAHLAAGSRQPARPAAPAAAEQQREGQERGSGAGAELVREDRAWLYQGLPGVLQTRRLRVWRLPATPGPDGRGRLLAIVTERPDDAGTSITNAVESVAAQLRQEFPGQDIELVEHYTPHGPVAAPGDDANRPTSMQGMSADGAWEVDFRYAEQAQIPGLPAEKLPDSYQRVTFDEAGRPQWTAVTGAELRAELGDAFDRGQES